MFDPIKASHNITEEFEDYLSTSLHVADKEYNRLFRDELRKEGVISKGPYLDIGDSFETGASLDELIEEDEVSPLFRTLENESEDGKKEIQVLRPLYKHQEQAIRKVNKGKNLVVTTGTGSGKTECFVIPIINYLLREKENGTLNDGVRAILVYPMNALANDQMKRLRETFKDCTDITFGVYNSSTQETDDKGVAEYGKIFKDSNGRPQRPLPNEVISRKRMRECPPNILVTNYAMLEYMLLRPNDDKVFSGAQLKFLVLDEAHIYKGATGMETSLLLRRLKARISKPENVIHILTSATLGNRDSDPEIVKFASTLCEAPFDEDDIIRSIPKKTLYNGDHIDVPASMFTEISEAKNSLESIFKKYDIKMTGSDEGEILYNLCASSHLYNLLREVAAGPMTIKDITAKMSEKIYVDEQDVVALIDVASKAEKNKTSLIKARYHLFVRALEGAYITIGDVKKLSLKRNVVISDGDDVRKLFECAVCNDCGRLAISGKVDNNRMVFSNNLYDNASAMLMPYENENISFDEDDDGKIGENDFYICPFCGEIHHVSQREEFKCDHPRNKQVKLIKLSSVTDGGSYKCPVCKSGRLKLFYAGYDAATAVLGTSLYEELPEYEVRLRVEEQKPVTGGLFGVRTSQKEVKEKKIRQFLAFSDSRGEAAFFASYMTNYYKEFLRRRGLWHVINDNQFDINRHPWEIKSLVEELTNYFDSRRSFAEPGDTGTENLHAESRRQAWIAVLNEMVNARRSTSLVSFGVMNFTYKGITDEVMQGVAEQYGKSVEDMKILFNLLVLDIVNAGAVEGDQSINIGDEQRKYIYFSIMPSRFKLLKDAEADKNKPNIHSWIPRKRTNGNYFRNARVERIVRTLGTTEDEAVKILKEFWEYILMGENGLTADDNGNYYISTDRLVVTSGNDETMPLYRCRKCGKITPLTESRHCLNVKCDGNLEQIKREDLFKENHYARLYSSDLMQPLHIKEHTAQLGRKEQQDYQEMFIKKQINALSCSTTFEMGVDVGDLETIYLRDVPPSPANYVQRAGRAGRSLKTAAFALTYAKLSSHDLTYYGEPEKMISGKIGVPIFTIKNVKVTLRHVFAVALSSFFANYEEVYNGNDADVFLNGDGYEMLKDYLEKKPSGLKKLLQNSIPEEMHEIIGIDDYSWIDKMIGEDGILEIAVGDFRNTVNWYTKEIKKLRKDGNEQEANRVERQLWDFRRSKTDQHGKNELIEFFVRNNVLPKYGFPVDTVELYQNSSATQRRLQMVRDLQLGVAEYAPGSHVVADGKMYTSRYIRRLPAKAGQSWQTTYIAQCTNPECKTMNYSRIKPGSDGKQCIACGELIKGIKWHRAIEPRKGFIADVKVEDVPMSKPGREYRGDDFYIGDVQRQVIDKKHFVIGDESIMIESSANDSLMVVCTDDFYVCSKCGWALNSAEILQCKEFESYKAHNQIKHKAPWGRECDGSVMKTSLNHVFKTDVVSITFESLKAVDENTMLSVMYALLEALSRELEIERSDVKGTLFHRKYKGTMIYTVILYDAVAGGAGQVRRLVTDDGEVFQRVLRKTIEITKGCSCSPSCYNCLRNYNNRNVHDKLDRHLVYNFLEPYVGKMQNVSNEIDSIS